MLKTDSMALYCAACHSIHDTGSACRMCGNDTFYIDDRDAKSDGELAADVIELGTLVQEWVDEHECVTSFGLIFMDKARDPRFFEVLCMLAGTQMEDIMGTPRYTAYEAQARKYKARCMNNVWEAQNAECTEDQE